MDTDGSLQIIGLYRYDSGLYICMASNGIGEPIKKEVYLTVKGMENYISITIMHVTIATRMWCGSEMDHDYKKTVLLYS